MTAIKRNTENIRGCLTDIETALKRAQPDLARVEQLRTAALGYLRVIDAQLDTCADAFECVGRSFTKAAEGVPA